MHKSMYKIRKKLKKKYFPFTLHSVAHTPPNTRAIIYRMAAFNATFCL